MMSILLKIRIFSAQYVFFFLAKKLIKMKLISTSPYV